jgi:hypothetical protein
VCTKKNSGQVVWCLLLFRLTCGVDSQLLNRTCHRYIIIQNKWHRGRPLEIQIYVGSKTLASNTLVSMLLVTFAFNLALILSLESFCVYFLVISISHFLVSFMKSVLFVWGLSLLWVKTMSKLCNA